MRLVTDALAVLLSQVLEEKGLSVRAAAERCDIGLGLLTNILYGRTARPRPETLRALSEGLGLSYETLALAAYGVIAPVPA